jgi:hypothetical protein
MAEAGGLKMRAEKCKGILSCVGSAIAKQDFRAVVTKQFVECVDETAFAVEIKEQRGELKFVEGDVRKTFDFEAKSGDGVLRFNGRAKPIGRDPLS